MSLAIVYTRAQLGVNAPLVTVEAHLSIGLPGFTIVGLPEAAVKESKDRVRSALINSHFEFPQQRITVNLAPADLPKEGGRYDLAIALGILAASEQIPSTALADYEFLGELALSGELRPVRGAIAAAMAADKAHRQLILAEDNGPEVSLTGQEGKFLAANLLRVCAHLAGREQLPAPEPCPAWSEQYEKDLSDVKGQKAARRALEVAAAGGHNLLLYGPPGTGKSMLASRLPTILPPLRDDEALEVAAVNSLAQAKNLADYFRRPFRSPHHTSSAVALVGGGANPKPGEISLAHRGVLFLDELPEFPRTVLEVLREPLETGCICISRANAQVEYPAQFQLVAAMNPCPCGYFGDNSGRCRCTPQQVARYRDKISGPLLDRIDIHLQVQAIPISELQHQSAGETSAQVRKRVAACQALQINRQGVLNAALQGKQLRAHCALGAAEQQLLEQVMQRLHLSARAYDRILRLARTLADLQQSPGITSAHLSEAVAYRSLDRASGR
ncbi:MAG TPA: YifB family Mg chelatase-like AAA ATPase [Cellvibrionaceae bacterium]|nr:YifB family Mg chelatase-like AAA ATPase [Cellvibrionaceae bacterium]